jgi:hypothetical protein
MSANFESPRYRRRYQVNASGFAEFDWNHCLRRFIPWYEVTNVHNDHQTGVFTIVTSSDHSLTPKLDRLPMKECYRFVDREWHLRSPHVYRERCARIYRMGRQVLLFWFPLLCVGQPLLFYALAWLRSRSGLIVDWDAVTKINQISLFCAIGLLVLWLMCFKYLRQDFGQFYADIEAALALEPETDRTAGRDKLSLSGIVRRCSSLIRPARQWLSQVIQSGRG